MSLVPLVPDRNVLSQLTILSAFRGNDFKILSYTNDRHAIGIGIVNRRKSYIKPIRLTDSYICYMSTEY